MIPLKLKDISGPNFVRAWQRYVPELGFMERTKRLATESSTPYVQRPIIRTQNPAFQLDTSISGSWIKFGDGDYTCPRRNNYKCEVLLAFARLITHFDIELRIGLKGMQMNWSTSGLGT
jgi:hypothetical protein